MVLSRTVIPHYGQNGQDAGSNERPSVAAAH